MSMINALLNPVAYPHPVDEIKLIETHISWVILTGPFAYKIKKNVQYDFLDFSTLEKRHYYCNEELRFNRRFAPDLYLAVLPITGTATHPAIGGEGKVLDYVIKMRQFDNNQLLSHIAERGQLSARIIDTLAETIAQFHLTAVSDRSSSHYGTPEEIQHWFKGNFDHITPLIKDRDFLLQINQLANWGESASREFADQMVQRKASGYIRECHGDLHLGNITLIDNQITPFDGIEFNPGLHWIDVISEIAFTTMDIQEYGYPQLAHRFLNHYLALTGDYAGLQLLPYYLVYRALVRCKVALLRWQQHATDTDLLLAKNYAQLARQYSTSSPARLVITHGYSGAGKSTYSARLAETMGWIHLRSDIERKRFSQSNPATENKVNQGRYTQENVDQVYQYLSDTAKSILSAGFSVIVDAAFLQQARRALFIKLAQALGVKLLILDFKAPNAVLAERITQRQQKGSDPSEATLAVLEHQHATAEALSDQEKSVAITIDTCDEQAWDNLLSRLQCSNEKT